MSVTSEDSASAAAIRPFTVETPRRRSRRFVRASLRRAGPTRSYRRLNTVADVSEHVREDRWAAVKRTAQGPFW